MNAPDRFRLGVIGRFARGGLSSPLARPWDYDGPIGALPADA